MKTSRRLLLAALLASAWCASAAAQTYPSKPIRLIVPFGAGQGADAAARIVAQKLSENIKQPVVIENRPGAGGNIGADAVAKAPADGYTLLVGSNGTHAANAALYPSLPFDPQNDFVPISYIGNVAMVVLAAPTFEATGIKGAIDLAKAKPDSVSVAIPSSTSRVVLELLTTSSGAKFFSVPYKASNVAMTDLIGGHVQLSIDTVIAARSQVTSGKLKALAVSSAARTSALPDTPTLAESGLAGFDLAAWNVWFAPRGTPPDIIATLNKEIRNVLADPAVQEQMRTLGYEPAGTETPDQVGAFIRAESKKWGDLIRAAGIKAE